MENYRAAHAIAGRNADGTATTEELRQAMVSYRALFTDLLEGQEPARAQAEEQEHMEVRP